MATPIAKEFILDLGIMSMLLIASHLIRYRVSLLQNLYLPSAVIAGLIALFSGHQFLNWIPFSHDPTGALAITTYPSYLVVFLFSTLFLGKSKTEHTPLKTLEHAGDTFFFNLSSLVGQYGFSLLFGLLVLTPLFPLLPKGFAIFLPAGFIGGYGTATAIGGVLEQGGWKGALSIGYASATVGMLTAVFAGMVLINIAVRKGWTRVVKSVEKMPKSMKSGFIPEHQRTSIGQETVSPIALDPLTWHVALVCSAGTLAFFLRDFLHHFSHGKLEIPVFCLGLLIGALIQKLFDVMGLGHTIDRHLIHRIGSWITDYLVAFGIASITVRVVIEYASALFLLFVFGFAFTLLLMWFVGQRIFKTFWFERGIAMYGWNTGSVATSVALLRVIDPDMKTPVLEEFGLAYIGIAFFEIAIIALLPPLVLNGILVGPTLILVGSFFVCLLLSRLLVGWFSYPPSAIRPGEKEILNQEI